MRNQKRGRGRPRREYRIRARAELRPTPDYDKLAQALLEHAAIQEREGQQHDTTATPDPDALERGDDRSERGLQ
ncbi:hypothetical protein LQ938_11440 [Microbacterium sp. cx-55]|uniref:hypothetical protein n=1 Tax=Microbacterium sp. cx-55 TaxID=2875948 RepID=UPI001CBBF489|nr:hypothetical protein [Microbacterium sp. cx-55]MBZ4488111.1 hypothetical protein [Microbacterium sp. cx-55]UGB34480.1 hypothetical protein LQ938_11440 [Microbacterium sp. cx-55]